MSQPKNVYLDVTYATTPFTDYPSALVDYLISKYKIQKDSVILDLGCGRGEILKYFCVNGMKGFGIDQADTAKKLCPSAIIKTGNIEKKLPFSDNTFDIVFSKSVLEHFYYPEKILEEVFRIIKPNGMVITMTPDWAYNIIYFHEDFTHRTAFTLQSINDIHEVSGFSNVKSHRFIQLPILWRFPILKMFAFLCRNLLPDSFKRYSKFIRFSKEIMLITAATKF